MKKLIPLLLCFASLLSASTALVVGEQEIPQEEFTNLPSSYQRAQQALIEIGRAFVADWGMPTEEEIKAYIDWEGTACFADNTTIAELIEQNQSRRAEDQIILWKFYKGLYSRYEGGIELRCEDLHHRLRERDLLSTDNLELLDGGDDSQIWMPVPAHAIVAYLQSEIKKGNISFESTLQAEVEQYCSPFDGDTRPFDMGEVPFANRYWFPIEVIARLGNTFVTDPVKLQQEDGTEVTVPADTFIAQVILNSYLEAFPVEVTDAEIDAYLKWEEAMIKRILIQSKVLSAENQATLVNYSNQDDRREAARPVITNALLGEDIASRFEDEVCSHWTTQFDYQRSFMIPRLHHFCREMNIPIPSADRWEIEFPQGAREWLRQLEEKRQICIYHAPTHRRLLGKQSKGGTVKKTLKAPPWRH